MPGASRILLAQTDVGLRYLAWAAVFALGLFLLAVVMAVVRRLTRGPREKPFGGNLSIEDLEKLLAAGRIDQAEFRSLRRAALGLPAAQGEDSHSSRPGEDDDEHGSGSPAPPAADEPPHGAQ